MQEIRDYSKEKVGALKPKDYFYKNGKIFWNCQCDCGNVVQRYSVLLGQSIKNNSFSTCGCMSRIIDGKMSTIVGKTFDNFRVISFDIKKFVYQCEQKGKVIYLTPVQVGRKLNWYFMNYEKIVKNKERLEYLGCSSQEEYNQKSIRLHHLLYLIKLRCYDTKCWAYNYYGGRGIKVAQEWLENSKSFVEWSLKNGYKENLEIDRIDNDGDYTPQNCRWATRLKNANNKRNNHYIEYKGIVKSLSEWCRELNLNYKNTHHKIKYKGFTLEDVIRYKNKKEGGN